VSKLLVHCCQRLPRYVLTGGSCATSAAVNRFAPSPTTECRFNPVLSDELGSKEAGNPLRAGAVDNSERTHIHVTTRSLQHDSCHIYLQRICFHIMIQGDASSLIACVARLPLTKACISSSTTTVVSNHYRGIYISICPGGIPPFALSLADLLDLAMGCPPPRARCPQLPCCRLLPWCACLQDMCPVPALWFAAHQFRPPEPKSNKRHITKNLFNINAMNTSASAISP
jgi:hypothetical protein